MKIHGFGRVQPVAPVVAPVRRIYAGAPVRLAKEYILERRDSRRETFHAPHDEGAIKTGKRILGVAQNASPAAFRAAGGKYIRLSDDTILYPAH
ncbi:MAG: hypothetical protein AAB472_00365 [Patescibacteria group bacterium]